MAYLTFLRTAICEIHFAAPSSFCTSTATT